MASNTTTHREALRDLHHLLDYRPMKTSFVIGLEKMCGLPQMVEPGERRALIDTEGRGSLRHIWETHGPGDPPFELEFFIDGEEQPSIRGRLEDLIDAAQRCDQPFVLNPGGTIEKGSHNLYLPVPFEESLRVDLVSTAPIGLVFLQLDYRLDDDSLSGARLRQTGEGASMQLAYDGPPRVERERQRASQLAPFRTDLVGDGRLALTGPGIIRRLSVNAVRPGVRLRMRFDGAESAAVDADLADFFGPFRGAALNNNRCYLPMPFAESAEIEIVGGHPSEEWTIEADVEETSDLGEDWGYFHAKSSRDEKTNGYLPFHVLYTRGRGHWIGMSLYDSGMDHGGGDFAVVDGETDRPAFLHGINGEDYFSFAFFGKGENFPYTEAFDNHIGRMRLHLENPYPFRESIEVSWGALRDLSPHAVSFWYQDSADDLTLGAEEAQTLTWDVFGPASVPLLDDGLTPDTSDPERLFAALADPAELDTGAEVEVSRKMFNQEFRGTFNGWAQQPAVGPHLNLMYVYGHVMDLGGHHHMGYDARCMMARTRLDSPTARSATLHLSYDDPIQVFLNGREIHTDMELGDGFVTRAVDVDLREGTNEIFVKMLDTPNDNTCWAGVGLRVID